MDVAGLNVRLSLGWRALLLSEGAVGVVALGGLAAGTGSVVLMWAAGASMVVLALGVAAVTAVPAPLALAAAAVGAHAQGRRRAAIGWATVAGLAPVLATGVGRILAFAAGRDLGAGTLEELGLVGTSAALTAVVSGVLCAGVLAREAGRTKDLALAALAGLSLASGAGTAWAASDPSLDEWALALPALFVTLHVTAMVAERDAFWRRPAGAAAFVGELLALLTLPLAALLVLFAPSVEQGLDLFSDSPPWRPDLSAALAWTLLATGWFLGAWRRRSPQPTLARAVLASATDDRTVAFAVAALAAGLVVGTASTLAIAGGFLVLAAALVASRRAVATLVAVPLATWAPMVLFTEHRHLVEPTGLVVVALFLGLGVRRWRGGPALVFAGLGTVQLLAVGALAAAQHGPAAGLLLLVFGAWVGAAAVEGHEPTAGLVVRLPMAIAAAAALAAPVGDGLPVVLAATFLFAVDAVRTDDPRLAFGAAVTFPFTLVVGGAAAGITTGDTGLVLALTSVVLFGLGVLTPDPWRLPVVAGAGWALVFGLTLATEAPDRFAQALLVAGGLLIAAGVTLREWWLAHGGGVLATMGTALLLSFEGVLAPEAYVAPVALQLAVLGWQLRRHAGPGDAPSSWVAFGPSMGLLALPALFERMDGGSAGHALVVGAVGLAGVALGGWQRLAGPLFLGTGLLVTMTFLESLHTLAGVPTWGWLAAGGTVLLATGVALERSATSPVEVGRRLVDEVAAKFD